MLLRRITKHVTDQNWFAVFIDFLIVVVGVFIGIQVANWNEAFANKQKAALYVENLKTELKEVMDSEYDNYERSAARVQRNIEVSNYLFEDAALEGLTEKHCDDLAHIHNLFRQYHQLTTIEELISSGTLNLIQDKKVRHAIVSFKNYTTVMLSYEEIRNNNKEILTKEFPSHFTVRPQLTDGGFINQIFDCDFVTMREDPKFLIYFARELSSATYYTHGPILKEKKLIDELIESLGINTPEDQ